MAKRDKETLPAKGQVVQSGSVRGGVLSIESQTTGSPRTGTAHVALYAARPPGGISSWRPEGRSPYKRDSATAQRRLPLCLGSCVSGVLNVGGAPSRDLPQGRDSVAARGRFAHFPTPPASCGWWARLILPPGLAGTLPSR